MGKIIKLVYFLDNTGDKGVDENTPIIPVQEHFLKLPEESISGKFK